MTSLEKTPPEKSPEERLRALLSAAVEPVQPGPGAQARLHARIHAGRRERDLPRRLRWAGASLGVVALVAGAAVVISTAGHSESSSSSTASAPEAAAASPEGALGYGKHAGPLYSATDGAGSATGSGTTANTPEVAAPAVPPRAAASQLSAGAGSGENASALDPLGRVPAQSDLDGDHSSDVLTVSGQRLVVQFRTGTQSVTLPPVSGGARVLGVTPLQTAQGGRTPVAFIRLGSDGANARDTLVAVVSGRLTVLRFQGAPVILTVSASQGYTCAGTLVVTSGTTSGYVVKGADLVADGSSGDVAKPGANCTFS